MGFFSEIRKVLFGVKAVSKSAAEKAFEAGKDATSSAMDKSGELLDKAKDKVEDIGSDVLNTAENVWDKAVDVAEDVGEKVLDKAGEVMDTVEDVGEKVLDKTSKVFGEIKEKGHKGFEKASDAFDNVKEKGADLSEKLMDQGEDTVSNIKDVVSESREAASEKLSSAKDFVRNKHDELFEMPEDVQAESDEDLRDDPENELTDEVQQSDSISRAEDKIATIGSAVLDAKSSMADKAKEAVDNLGDKLDETIEKAEKLAVEEAAQPKYKPHSEILEKDLLEDKDDFFKKAEAFADGRYEEVTDPFADPKPKIVHHPEENEVVQEEKNSEPLPGFEDLDGDGNEIVDDALVVSSEEE